MLALLFLANVAMLMGMTNWPQRTREGFACRVAREGFKSKTREHMDNIPPYAGLKWSSRSLEQGSDFQQSNPTSREGFMNYLRNGFATDEIGSYDGKDMAAGLPKDAQGYRARMPNVPHPKGTDMLPFVNNVCKPECCSSTMSYDGGGCVCTTPEDRDLINTRGGNRRHEDGF
jgi:hypothetical protein